MRLQVPFFDSFVDLWKAYDTVDRERTLDILVAYGVGPQAITLLHQYWDLQQVVARQNGYHGEAFRPVTQGAP